MFSEENQIHPLGTSLWTSQRCNTFCLSLWSRMFLGSGWFFGIWWGIATLIFWRVFLSIEDHNPHCLKQLQLIPNIQNKKYWWVIKFYFMKILLMNLSYVCSNMILSLKWYDYMFHSQHIHSIYDCFYRLWKTYIIQ